jgi:hypothetical protein
MIARGGLFVSQRYLFLAVAFSSLTGLLVGIALSQPPSPSTRQEESTPQQSRVGETKQKPDVASDSTRSLDVRITKTAEEADEEKEQRQQDSYGRWVTMGLSVFTFLVLVVQLTVMNTQNRIMERQSRIFSGQLSATKKSADASIRSADTASAASEHEERITKLSTRAYISATGEKAAAFFQDAHHVFEAGVTIVNRGTTPAYDVTVTAALCLVDSKTLNDFDYPPGKAALSVSVLGPGLSKNIQRWLPDKVPEADVEQIMRGGPPQCLLMYGTVKYKDAHRAPHFTNFSHTVLWKGWVPGAKDKDGNTLLPVPYSSDTAKHNDAD